MTPPTRPPYRWVVVVYDRLYRALHGLDHPATEVGPALRIELRRCRRHRRLPDGTLLLPGARIGILHLNNDRIVRLHTDGLGPMGVGLEFRRQLLRSLRVLADRVLVPGPLADVQAFAATTIFHEGLARLGFRADPLGPAWPRVVGTYQRALLASLHPAGVLRLRRATYYRARRLWLTRQELLARYGAGIGRMTDAG